MMCSLMLFSQEQEACYGTVNTDGSSYTPPRVEMGSGLERQNNFVPSRLFRKYGREASKLTTGGGGADLIPLARPPWRKKRSLVTLCMSKWNLWYLYTSKRTKTFRFWRPHAQCSSAFFFCDFSWPKTPLVACALYLVSVCNCFWVK